MREHLALGAMLQQLDLAGGLHALDRLLTEGDDDIRRGSSVRSN